MKREITKDLPDFKELLNKGVEADPSMLKMAQIFNEYETKYQGKTVAPDTAGADFFFVFFFLDAWEMREEFWYFGEEFLKHCYHEIPELVKVGWCDIDRAGDASPDEVIFYRITNLLLNAVKSDNLYAKELLKYLYKTYYKKEYNRLKRFRRITIPEIFALGESGEGVDYGAIARVLVLCPLMGIELEERCGLLYLFLDMKRKEWMDYFSAECSLEIEEKLYQESRTIVEEWFAGEEKLPRDKKQKKYWEAEKFVENCLAYNEFPVDYLTKCDYGDNSINRYAKVLSILKKTYPKREFSYEEVQLYAHIYQLIDTALMIAIRHDEDGVGMLGYRKYEFPEDYDEERALFKAEAVLPAHIKKALEKPNASKSVSKPVLANVAPINGKNLKEEDYLREINELRRKLHLQENEIRYLREQKKEDGKALKEAQAIAAKYENDREELIALRNHVYLEAQDLPEVREEDLMEMQKEIGRRSIIVIGGHVNLQNKLKQVFPEWKFINLEHDRTVDPKMVEGCEKVYFFTNHLSHLTYFKFVNILREKKIPFGYLNGVNVESLTRRVWEDLK